MSIGGWPLVGTHTLDDPSICVNLTVSFPLGEKTMRLYTVEHNQRTIAIFIDRYTASSVYDKRVRMAKDEDSVSIVEHELCGNEFHRAGVVLQRQPVVRQQSLL